MKNKKLAFVLFFLTFALYGYFAPFQIDSHHDGLVLKPAFDMLAGKTLFLESFTQYGLLFHSINALVLKLFGSYLLNIRLVTVGFYSGCAVLLWFINRRLLSPLYTTLLLLFWVSLAPIYTQHFHSWASVYALFFQLLSVLLCLKYGEQKNIIFLFIAGASSALTFWCRFPVGTLLIFFQVLFYFYTFILHKKRKTFYIETGMLLLGFIVTSIPFFLYLLAYNAFTDWWLQTVTLGPSFAKVIRGTSLDQIIKSLFLTRYLRDGTYVYHLIWLFIPLTAVYLTIKNVLLNNIKKMHDYSDLQIILIGLIGISSWFQYYPTVDYSHFYWAAGPMIGLYFFLITNTIKKQTFSIQQIFKIYITVIILFFLMVQISIGTSYQNAAPYYLQSPAFLKKIGLTEMEYAFYQNISNTLTEVFYLLPNKTYINHTGDAMLSLLHQNYFSIHKTYINWTFVKTAIYPEYDQIISKYVITFKPLIFTADSSLFLNYCDMHVLSNQGVPLKLLIAKDDGEKIQKEWNKKTKTNLFLRPFNCSSGPERT